MVEGGQPHGRAPDASQTGVGGFENIKKMKQSGTAEQVGKVKNMSKNREHES